MAASLLTVLREARSALGETVSTQPAEIALANRLAQELDEAIARLEGKAPARDLVAIICHDLKDPLASVIMGAGFLKKTVVAEDAGPGRVIDAIARSADRMSRVIDDFHDLAKLENGALPIEMAPCDVHAELQSAIASLAPQAGQRGVTLRVEAPDGPVLARCDRVRLAQIVAKLVGNALRFTAAEGEVVVRVEREDAQVRVTVRDNGRGIPAERLGEIFDRRANARRTSRDGPGLGLAIARGLVELHGGTVGVESRLGGGSLFWFTLPRAP